MMLSDESMINILKEEVVGLKAALKFTEEKNKLLKKHYEKSMSSLSTKLAEFEELLHREKERIVKLLQEKDEKINFQKVIIKSLQSEKNVEESHEDGMMSYQTQHNLSNAIKIKLCPLTANQFSSLNISQDDNIVTGKVNELIHSHKNHHKSDDFKNTNYALMGIENQNFRNINSSLAELQEYNLEPDRHLNVATSAEKFLNKFSTQLISSMFQLVNKEILNQSFEKKFQNYIYSFSSNLVCSCIKSATIELGLLSNQPDLKIVVQNLPELNQPNQRNEIQIQTEHSNQLINQASNSSEINYQSEKKPDFYPNALKTLNHTDLLKNESNEKENKPELHSKIENNLDHSNQIKKQSDIGSKSLNQSDHDNQIKHQLDHNIEIQNLPGLSSEMLNLLDQSDAIKYQLKQPVHSSEMQNQPDFNTEIQTQLDLDSEILNQPDQNNIMKNQLNQFTQPNHNNKILNHTDLSNSIENQLNQPDHSSEIQNQTGFSSKMVNQLKHSNSIDNQLNQPDHSYPMKNLLNNGTKIHNQYDPCSEMLNQPDLTNTIENKLNHQEHSNEIQKQHGFSSEMLNQPDHSNSIENQLNQPSHNSETQKQIDFSIEILNQSDHSNLMENQMIQLKHSSEIQDQTDFISEIQNQPDHSNALENQCNPPDYRSEIEKQQVVSFEMLIELGHCGAIKNPLNQSDYSDQLQNQHLNSEIPKQPDHSISLENQLNQSDHSIGIRNQPDYRNELQKQLDFNSEIFSQLGKSSSIENQLNQPNHSNDKQSQSDLSSEVLKQIDYCYPIEKQFSQSESNNENQRGCCNEILNYPDLSNETQSTKQNSEHLYATESTSSDSIKSREEIVINTVSSNENISNISEHLDPTSILFPSIKMCDNPTEDTFTDGTNDLRKEIVHLVESCLNFVEKILPKKGCDPEEVVNMLPPIDLCIETQDNVGNNMKEFGSFFESEYAIPELSDCSMSLKLDSHRLDSMDNCCHIMNLSTTQMIDTHVPLVNETTTRDLSYSPS